MSRREWFDLDGDRIEIDDVAEPFPINPPGAIAFVSADDGAYLTAPQAREIAEHLLTLAGEHNETDDTRESESDVSEMTAVHSDGSITFVWPSARDMARFSAGDIVTVEWVTGGATINGRLANGAAGAELVVGPGRRVFRYANGRPSIAVEKVTLWPTHEPEPDPEPVCEWPAAVVEKVARVLCLDLSGDPDAWASQPEAYRAAYRDDARKVLAVVPYVADPFADVETDRLRQILVNPNSLTLSEAASFAARRIHDTITHREQMGTA